jgi:hypothetical protein
MKRDMEDILEWRRGLHYIGYMVGSIVLSSPKDKAETKSKSSPLFGRQRPAPAIDV